MATARRNVTRERKIPPAEKARRKLKGEPGKKKLSPGDKQMRKKKLTNKEAGELVKQQTKHKKIKRLQKKATIGNKPGIRAKNQNFI